MTKHSEERPARFGEVEASRWRPPSVREELRDTLALRLGVGREVLHGVSGHGPPVPWQPPVGRRGVRDVEGRARTLADDARYTDCRWKRSGRVR